MSKTYKYKAFISYSHKDQEFATWLHKSIENYKIPKHLYQLYSHLPKNLKRSIFKDQEELSSASSLASELKIALETSEKLIVICSKNSKNSLWVEKEIIHFQTINHNSNILTVIQSGKTPNVVPSILTQVDEPLSINASLKSERKTALLKVIAAVLDISYANLVEREKKESQKRLALKGVFFLLVFSIAFYAYQQSILLSSSKHLDNQQNENAYEYALFLEQQKNFTKAKSILEELLTYELDKEEKANVLNRLGILYRKLKQPKKAEQAYLKALNKRISLTEAYPKLYANDLAWTYNNLGVLYKETKQNKASEDSHFKALALRRTLSKEDKNIYDLHLSCSMHNLGELYASSIELTKAENAFTKSLKIRRVLFKKNPEKFRPMLATTLQELALLYDKEKAYEQSEKLFLEALSLREVLFRKNPNAYKSALFETVIALAKLYQKTNRQQKEETLHLKYRILK